MKRILFVIAMLIAVPGLTLGQTGNKKGGDEQQAVKQVINDLAAALGKNDVAALDRIYADDYIVTNENAVMTDKAARLAAIKSGALKFESVVFSEIKVNVYGDAAVVRFRGSSKVQSADAQPLGGDLRVTATLIKTKGRWQVVAAHVTRVAGQ
jgi:ketosteroid isomerase-like protein